MPPAAVGITFTTVSDIAAWLGSTGVRLRLVDDGSTTGTVTGASNTTPIVITSAAHGLNTGDLVQMQGVRGNTWSNGLFFITKIDTDNFALNASTGVAAYTSGGTWIGIGYPESSWAPYAVQVGTATVKRFTQQLYDSADLQNSWSVFIWATIAGCFWMCQRRGNPIPASLNNQYLQTLDELEGVKKGAIVIEDIQLRNECFPTFSNLRVDRRWSVKQMRVVAGISGRTAPQFPRFYDLASQIIAPAEINSIN